MALPARRIPESVAHLDVEMVAAALIRNDANVRNAARALGVPSGDLRKLVLVDQRLSDAALEAIELRLDDCETNLHEALHCGDPRRRDAVSMFMLRNVGRAAKRGYAVAAAGFEASVSVVEPPRRIIIRWRNSGESDDEKLGEDEWKPPTYGGGRRVDADIEGKLASPASMIEHADTRGLEAAPGLEVEPAEEPSTRASEPEAPVSALPAESAAARYEREQIDA